MKRGSGGDGSCHPNRRGARYGNALYLVHLGFGSGGRHIDIRTSRSLAADVVFAPSAIPGVSFVGFGDPGFPAALQKAIPSADDRSNLASVLPRGAVMTNTGTRPIVYLAVHFEYTDAATGKVRTSNEVIDRTTARPGSWIQPGTALFFSPNVPDHYQGDSIQVSLDAVAFDDGEFAGPDVSDHYLEMTVESAAREDLFSEFGSCPDERRRPSRNTQGDYRKSTPSAPMPPLSIDVRWRTRQRTASLLLLKLRYSRSNFESMLDSKGIVVHRQS